MSAQKRAWILPVLSAALVIAGFAAGIAGYSNDHEAIWLPFSFLISITAFSVVGGLIASRHPGNSVGWLLAVIGFMFALLVGCATVARWGLLSGSLPRPLAEWIDVGGSAWVVALGLIGTQLALRLPDGELPSPRWRWFSRLTIVLIAISVVGISTPRGQVEGIAGTENPLGSAWAEQLSKVFFLVIASFLVCIAALIRRYRRSTGRDRAQLRWVAFSGAVFVGIYVVTLTLLSFIPENSREATFLVTFVQVAFAALPIGIGFAVLRQRLYDIDVVINRALVYGSLTASLAGTYLGSVLLLQLLLEKLTAGSGLAVAASTLATAALVRPARARIQRSVDRRFFRHKYDAAKTLERFGARVRDEVDLDALTAELRAVVAETMQPIHLTLWVRAPETAR